MAAQPKKKRQDWYKVSVDALRGWIITGVLAVVVIGGYFAYGVLEARYLEGKVGRTIHEARTLAGTVRKQQGVDAYREEYESAQEHLRAAQDSAAKDQLSAALASAERSRVLLTSILRALLRLETSGEAQFISVQGDVDYRRGERGDWRRARTRDVLQAGDYVKTSDGSAEIMSVDGTVYSVRSDTVIIVGKTSFLSGGAAERTISLDRGWVDLSTSLARSTVKTPEAEALVEKESTAVVAYDDAQRKGRFAAYRGAIDVESSQGQSRRVRTLEHVAQTGGVLGQPERLPPAPLPVDPADYIEVALDLSDRLVLNWQPVMGSQRYALQVARNRLFVHKLIDVSDRASTQATLGLRGDGTFVWRVAAFTDDGVQGPWSDHRTFRVNPPEVILEEAEDSAPPPES